MPVEPTDVEHSIPELFARQARLHASRPAIISVRGQISYEALDCKSDAIAAALLAMGHRRGTTVGIMIEEGIDQVAAILGALKAGGIYVPLDPSLKRERLHEILSDARPSGILTDNLNHSLACRLAAGSFLLNVEEDHATGRVPGPTVRVSPDDYAYIYYTSGTTSAPKGVVDNHRNVIHNIARYTTSLGVRYDDRLTLLQSCGFSGAVSNIFTALLNGATLLPFDVRGAGVEALAVWLAKQNPTIYHSVPSLFRQVAARIGALPSWRAIRLEGDMARPVDVAVFNRHFRSGCSLVNGLGATETGISAQYFIPHGTIPDDDVVPVGRPTVDVQINVVDPQGRPVESGALGEIVVSSRYLACGYWRRPDLTAAVFSEAHDGTRSYQTRDRGRFNDEGFLEVHGRIDHMIKVRGEWLDAGDLERRLTMCAGVREAIAEIRSDPQGNSERIAWIIRDDTNDSSEDQLREALGSKVPDARLLPTRFVFLDRWPVDVNGKLDRRSLHAASDFSTSVSKPTTSTERLVADVFGRCLGVPNVSATDDFFGLGGDSLKAIEVCLELERLTGSGFVLGAFQHSSSVKALAAMLDGAIQPGCVVPLQSIGEKPALFCVHAHMGHVFNLRELALQFAPERQFFGIQARGLDGLSSPATDLGAMADDYVACILELQPNEPYLLSGYCFGSWVALEMARRLRDRGKRVAALLLIDPELPPGAGSNTSFGRRTSNAPRLTAARLPEIGRLSAAARGRARRLRKRIRARLLAAVARLPERSGWRKRILRLPADGIDVMTPGYRPDPYDGTAVVLVPGDKIVEAGAHEAWQCLVRGGVRFDPLVGPTTDLLRHPYVRDLAMRLLAWLPDG